MKLAKGDLVLCNSNRIHFSLSTYSHMREVLSQYSVYYVHHLAKHNTPGPWNATEANLDYQWMNSNTLIHNGVTSIKGMFTEVNGMQLRQIWSISLALHYYSSMKTLGPHRNNTLPFELIGEKIDYSIQRSDNPRMKNHQSEWSGVWDSSQLGSNHLIACHSKLVPCR